MHVRVIVYVTDAVLRNKVQTDCLSWFTGEELAMSRTLRIIDGIIIALIIAAAVLTYIPQIFGIGTTEIGTEMLGNVDVGSLVYTEEAPTTSVQKGDRILNLTDNSASIYTVTSYDPSAGTVDVDGGEETTYKLSENYLRVLTVIPYVGYFGLAIQSQRGMILLGVLLCYVIISLVAAAFIHGDDEDDDYDEDYDDDEEDEFYSSLAKKKKKMDAERDADDEDDDEEDEDDDRRSRKKAKDKKDRKDRKDNKKENRRSEKRNRRKKSSDEDSYDDAEDAGDNSDGMTEISEAKTSVPGAAADETDPEVSSESLTNVQAALEAALDKQPMNQTEETPAERVRPADTASQTGNLTQDDAGDTGVNENGEIELAMPVRTADEILSKAYAAGLDPTVEEDKSTGVTLVDYSDSL